MKQVLNFTEFGQLEFEKGILTVRVIDSLELTEDILQLIYKQGAILARGKPYCILADIRKNMSSTSNARKYGANNPYNEKHLAYALLADTIPVMLLANFFININQPKIPTRLFKKEEKAIEWLKKHLR